MDRTRLDHPFLYPVGLQPPDKVDFIALGREALSAEPFHDRRIATRYASAGSLPARDVVAWNAERRAATESALAPPAPRFIFHHGFALSTLLSRWLDRPGSTLVLREPSLLTDLSELDLHDRSALRNARGRELCGALLALLCRTERSEELPVIKGCDSLTGIIGLLLEVCPDARGVLLYSDLDTFVLSCLKADSRRRWARDRVIAFRAWDLPEALWALDPSPLADAEIAACLWAIHVTSYTRLVCEFPLRLQPWHCERLLLQPSAAAQIAEFLALRAPDDVSLSSPSSAAHAKTGAPYDAAAREREIAELSALYAAELKCAHDWLDRNAARIPIDRAFVTSMKKNDPR